MGRERERERERENVCGYLLCFLPCSSKYTIVVKQMLIVRRCLLLFFSLFLHIVKIIFFLFSGSCQKPSWQGGRWCKLLLFRCILVLSHFNSTVNDKICCCNWNNVFIFLYYYSHVLYWFFSQNLHRYILTQRFVFVSYLSLFHHINLFAIQFRLWVWINWHDYRFIISKVTNSKPVNILLSIVICVVLLLLWHLFYKDK